MPMETSTPRHQSVSRHEPEPSAGAGRGASGQGLHNTRMSVTAPKPRRQNSSIRSEGEEEEAPSTTHPQPHHHDHHSSLTLTGRPTRPQRLRRPSVSSEEDQEETSAGRCASPPSAVTHHHQPHGRNPHGFGMSMTQLRPQYRAAVISEEEEEPQTPAPHRRRSSVMEAELFFQHRPGGVMASWAARRSSRRFSHSHLLTYRQMGQISRSQPKHPFRVYARLAVICVRMCRISQQTLEKERGEMLSLRQVMNLFNADIDKSGVFFDLTDYRADKENHLSQEARRVLLMSPKDRTDRDIAYLLVALRNIAAFAEYPARMQKKLCQVAWFERYESGRTIVREGDPPRAFYFILSGSVDVTQCDRQYGTTRILVSLHQGMSFGELAVVTRSRRQASVSSQTCLELLCISGADFEDIFMAGRKVITDPVHHSFLRSVSFLRHWPVQQLSQHPQACMFHYFNRGQVLVRDSNNSDWIYIVKSGSLSVMKKLHHVDADDDDTVDKGKEARLHLSQNGKRKRKERMHPESKEMFRNNVEADRRLEQSLPGVFNVNQRLGIIDYDQIITTYRSRVQPKVGSEPQSLTLPQIQTPAEVRRVSAPEANSAATADPGLERGKTNTAETEVAEGQEGSEASSSGTGYFEKVSALALDKLSKVGVYLGPATSRRPAREVTVDNPHSRNTSQASHSSQAKTDTHSSIPASEGTATTQLQRLNIDYQRKFREHVGRKTMADQLDYKGSRDFRYTEVDLNPMFVLVQVLEKGQYFGVSQLVYPDQPSLSLVSNGAELVILSKKLFVEHASDTCMRHLRRTESPFPGEDVLQGNLQDYINWEAHRARVYHRLVSGVRQKQARRKQYLPSVPPGSFNFRSGP